MTSAYYCSNFALPDVTVPCQHDKELCRVTVYYTRKRTAISSMQAKFNFAVSFFFVVAAVSSDRTALITYHHAVTSVNLAGLGRNSKSTSPPRWNPCRTRAFQPSPKMTEEAPRLSTRTKYHLQRGIDYFDHYRRQDLRRWREHERRPIFAQFPIPFNQSFQPDTTIVDPDEPIPEREYRLFSQIRRIDDGAGRTVPENLRANLEDIGWRFVKILGAGSQGLAMLFESTDDGRKTVFKWSTEVFSTAREMWAMRQMVGARHIIQVRLHMSLNHAPTIWLRRAFHIQVVLNIDSGLHSEYFRLIFPISA